MKPATIFTALMIAILSQPAFAAGKISFRSQVATAKNRAVAEIIASSIKTTLNAY